MHVCSQHRWIKEHHTSQMPVLYGGFTELQPAHLLKIAFLRETIESFFSFLLSSLTLFFLLRLLWFCDTPANAAVAVLPARPERRGSNATVGSAMDVHQRGSVALPG